MSTPGSYYVRYSSLNNIIIVPTVDFSPPTSGEKKHGQDGDLYKNILSDIGSVDSSITINNASFGTDSAGTDSSKTSTPITPDPPEDLPATSKTSSIKELSSSKYKSRNNLVDLTGFNILKRENNNTIKCLDSKHKEEKIVKNTSKTDKVFEDSNKEQNLTMEAETYVAPFQPLQEGFQTFQEPYQPLEEQYQAFLEQLQPHQGSYLRETLQPTQGQYQSFQEPLQESYQPLQETLQPLQEPYQTFQEPYQPHHESFQPLQESFQQFQEPYQPFQEISSRNNINNYCEENSKDIERSVHYDSDMEDKMKKYFKHLWNRRIERIQEKLNVEKVSKLNKIVCPKTSKYIDRDRVESKTKYKKVSEHRDETHSRIKFKDTSKEYQDFVRKFRGSSSRSKNEFEKSSRERTRVRENADEYLSPSDLKRYRDFQRFMEKYRGEYIKGIPRIRDNTERKKTPLQKRKEEYKKTVVRKTRESSVISNIKHVDKAKLSLKRDNKPAEAERGKSLKSVVQITNKESSKETNDKSSVEPDLRSKLSRKRPRSECNTRFQKTESKNILRETQENETLLITVKQDVQSESTITKKPAPAPNKKPKANKFKKIKLVINIKCGDSGDSDDSDLSGNEHCTSPQDLSFLDDINVDEIVDSLSTNNSNIGSTKKVATEPCPTFTLLSNKTNKCVKSINNNEIQIKTDEESKVQFVSAEASPDTNALPRLPGSSTMNKKLNKNQIKKDAEVNHLNESEETVDLSYDIDTSLETSNNILDITINANKTDNTKCHKPTLSLKKSEKEHLQNATHKDKSCKTKEPLMTSKSCLKKEVASKQSKDPVEVKLETIFNNIEDDLGSKLEEKVEALFNTGIKQESDLIEQSLNNIFSNKTDRMYTQIGNTNNNACTAKHNNTHKLNDNNDVIINNNTEIDQNADDDQNMDMMSSKYDLNKVKPVKRLGKHENDLPNKVTKVNNGTEEIARLKTPDASNMEKENVLHSHKRATSTHLKINRVHEINSSEKNKAKNKETPTSTIKFNRKQSNEQEKSYSDTKSAKDKINIEENRDSNKNIKTTNDGKSINNVSRMFKKENVDTKLQKSLKVSNTDQRVITVIKTVSKTVLNKIATKDNNKYVKDVNTKENNKSINNIENNTNKKSIKLNDHETDKTSITPTKQMKDYREKYSKMPEISNKLRGTGKLNPVRPIAGTVNHVQKSVPYKVAPEEYHMSHNTANNSEVTKKSLKPTDTDNKASTKTVKEREYKLSKESEKYCKVLKTEQRHAMKPTAKVVKPDKISPIENNIHAKTTRKEENNSSKASSKESSYKTTNTIDVEPRQVIKTEQRNQARPASKKVNPVQENVSNKNSPKENNKHVNSTNNTPKKSLTANDTDKNTLKKSKNIVNLSKRFLEFKKRLKFQQRNLAGPAVVSNKTISGKDNKNLNTNNKIYANQNSNLDKTTKNLIKINDHEKPGTVNITPKKLLETEKQNPAVIKAVQETATSKIVPNKNKKIIKSINNIANSTNNEPRKANDHEKSDINNIALEKALQKKQILPVHPTANSVKTVKKIVLNKTFAQKNSKVVMSNSNNVRNNTFNKSFKASVKYDNDNVEKLPQKHEVPNKVVRTDLHKEEIKTDQESVTHKIVADKNNKAVKNTSNIINNTNKESLKANDYEKIPVKPIKINVEKLCQLHSPDCLCHCESQFAWKSVETNEDSASNEIVATDKNSKCVNNENNIEQKISKTDINMKGNEKEIKKTPPNVNLSLQKHKEPSQKSNEMANEKKENLQTLSEKGKISEENNPGNPSSVLNNNTEKKANEELKTDNSNKTNMSNPSQSLQETSEVKSVKESVNKNVQSEDKNVDLSSNTSLNAVCKTNIGEKPTPKDNINKSEENKKEEQITYSSPKSKEIAKTDTDKNLELKQNPDSNENKDTNSTTNTEMVKEKRDETKPIREEETFSAKFKSIIDVMESRMYDYFHKKYTVTSQIHYGNHTVIYKCKDDRGKIYSIKMLHSVACRSFGIQKDKMFMDVQKYTSSANSCLLYLLSGFNVQGHWCFLTEYYPQNLAQAMEGNGKSFHIDTVQILSRQLVAAVNALTGNKIIHSDIKPTHILLNNSITRLKLAGFDRCDYYQHMKMLPTTGTPNYRAPELILGYPADYRIDVWASALVMFEMATNNKLFPGVHNNDILYKQICTLGSFEMEMIDNSTHRHQYFVGTSFRRTFPNQKSMMVHAFQRNNKFRGQIFTTYSRDWESSRTKWQATEDLDKLENFYRLLQQMLTLDPKHRLPIQFVEANEFIHDMFA